MDRSDGCTYIDRQIYMQAQTDSFSLNLKIFCIRGIFGSGFNLVVWRMA